MKVYRAIRNDEDPAMGLRPKNAVAQYSPEGHVLHGSRPGFASQYISTTTNLELARRWAARTGQRIVEIDLARVTAPVIDLSTQTGRDAHLQGFAAAASEVLIEGPVPADAMMATQ